MMKLKAEERKVRFLGSDDALRSKLSPARGEAWLDLPKSHSHFESGTQHFFLIVSQCALHMYLISTSPLPVSCVHIDIYALLPRHLCEFNLQSAELEERLYSQNMRLAGLWCYICNSIIFTACVIFCIQCQSILRGSHQVPREMGYSFHWSGKEQVEVADFRGTHCLGHNRCRFRQ